MHKYTVYISIYVHGAQINCQHGPCESAAPPTASSGSFKRAMDQLPTADKAVFVIFFFFFITHHWGPRVTLISVFIWEPETTTRAEVNMWHYCVPIELTADCQGRTTAGSWDSSWSHFGPFGVRPTLVGGDWEVNKQQVNQQHSPVDTVSSRSRWGQRRACSGGDESRPSHGKNLAQISGPDNPSSDPSLAAVAAETDELSEDFLSDCPIPETYNVNQNHCWKDLHQPYPKMPSTTNNYQVFLCCTKNTMSVSLSSPEFLPLSPPPQHLSCSCLSVAVLTIFSQTHKHTHGPLSLDYLLKRARTVTWPLGVATLSVTNLLCCRVFQ